MTTQNNNQNTTSGNNVPAPTAKAPIKQLQEETVSQVLERIQTFQDAGELLLPKDYHPGNAIKAAWLILLGTKTRDNKPVLEACTKESICNALLKMVVLGLSPLKKQCDFIAYGDQLSCDMEYTGNIVLAKRYGGLKYIVANVVLEGDEFDYEINPETGRKKVVKHVQKLDDLAELKIKGAYASYELEDGTRNVEIMNFRQIQQAWMQGAAKGNSPAHQKFPDQMSIKTVISRACKLLIRGSNDNLLLDRDDESRDPVVEGARQEIKAKANKTQLSVNEAATTDARVMSSKINNGAKKNEEETQPIDPVHEEQGPGY